MVYYTEYTSSTEQEQYTLLLFTERGTVLEHIKSTSLNWAINLNNKRDRPSTNISFCRDFKKKKKRREEQVTGLNHRSRIPSYFVISSPICLYVYRYCIENSCHSTFYEFYTV